MRAISWMLSLSFVGAASLGCAHQDPVEPDAGGLQPAGPASATSELQSTSHLTRHLYVLNEAPSCATTLAGFFQCVLGQTNWNSLALTYAQGETILWGGQKVTSGVPCGQGDFQCAENQGGWTLADFDIILMVLPNGVTGGENGTATVRDVTGTSHSINTGFIGDARGSCSGQTIYGGHEVFEAQTDGISADCCDGELPFQTSACHAPTQSYGGADAHACAKYAPSGCCDQGVCSSDPFGIRSLSCGGTTYQYQMVSPAGHESDGTCMTITGPGGASGVGVASGTCTQTEINNARIGTVNYWTCQGNARYLCDERSNKIVEACPSGCTSAGAGADDQCNGGGGPSCTPTEITNQTGSGSALPSIWTCEGSARYVCDGKGFKVTESCANGCQGEGFNHDDQCL